jgi:putative endonuclease
VEVKYRKTFDTGLEAVNLRSQKRIIAAAEYFRSHHPRLAPYDVRFDIVTVNPSFFIRHRQNAWYAS